MRRMIISALVMMVIAGSTAAQEISLRPQLSDPVDRQVQRLQILSQRDEAFDGIAYYGGYIAGRGCQPVSIANAVIASLGVEDGQAAAGVVKETTKLLVLPNQQGKGKIEIPRLSLLLDPQTYTAQQDKYPDLAEAVGGFAGKTAFVDEQMDALQLKAFLDETQAPFVLASRMTVHPDWTALLEQIRVLYEAGMDDALVCLANVGVGRETSKTPLRLGENGHYLTLLIHVGTFWRQGRIYVLDSLPRAIKGETWGYTVVLRRPYPFTEEKSAFSEAYQASRIRETVIRLTRKDEAAWAEADVAQKAESLEPLILYGPGILMIAVN